MNHSKTRKYIAYAIGEIILVVIGILIALWLNNWNKDKEIAHYNRKLQEKVLVQLEKDIDFIDAFRKDLDTLNNIYLKVLGQEHDKTKINNDALISTVLFDAQDLGLNKQNVNWIDNGGLDNSKISENLINLSSNYKLYFKNIDDIEKIVYNKFTTNLEYLEKTQPWYAKLITNFRCENDCINYLLYDEGHKSRIASLRFLYVIGYGELVKGWDKKKLEKLINEKGY